MLFSRFSKIHAVQPFPFLLSIFYISILIPIAESSYLHFDSREDGILNIKDSISVLNI